MYTIFLKFISLFFSYFIVYYACYARHVVRVAAAQRMCDASDRRCSVRTTAVCRLPLLPRHTGRPSIIATSDSSIEVTFTWSL